MGKVRALPGAWYGDVTPRGSFAALYPTDLPDPRIETSHGRIELPGQNVLYLVCADVGPVLCLAGAVKFGDVDTAILWNGQEWIPLCPAYGTSPVAFGPDGVVYVSSVGAAEGNVRMFSPTGSYLGAFTQSIGSRGIAAVDERGVHSVDEWYGKFGLAEYVEVDGYRIGQGTTSRDGLVAAGYGPLIPDGLCQFIRVHLRDGQFGIATWRPTEGQLMHLWLTVDELEAMRPLVIEVPTIGRPLWLGGFMFDNAPAPMGNCTLAVRNVSGPQRLPVIVTEETVDQVSGTILGHFVSGATVEDIEARAAQLPRPVAYWDARRWPRYPNLPPHAWLCLQAYCRRDETPEAFEADMRAVLATVPAGVDVALVAQCYTSNANLTPDIAALVPVFARLCEDTRVVALLPFSFSGRATGLQDHPDAAVTWQSLAAGIAGTPPIPPMEPPMKKCEVTVDAFTLTPVAKLPDGVAFEIHDRENPHGAVVRGWVEGGSMRFSIDYQGLPDVKGETAARRPVR